LKTQQIRLKEINSVFPPGDYYFSGAEAMVEGAIAAGCNYYGGYPITPATEVMERMSVRLPGIGGVFMQMEDEIASISSVVGASWAGAKAMTATSGPGFSLMQETIGYAAMTETPIVIADIQRQGPSTGGIGEGAGDIMQARWGSHGNYQMIAIYPWSVQEMYDQTITAFNYAERYRTPVIILGEAVLAHQREKLCITEKVKVFERIKKPGAPPFCFEEVDGGFPLPSFGEKGRILVSGTTHEESGIRKPADSATYEALTAKLHNKIMDKKEEIVDYETYHLEEDVDVAVVAYGFTARSSLFAVEEMRQEGKKVGMLRLKTMWPFADKAVEYAGAKAKKILVPEMNKGQIVGEVMKYASCDVVSYTQTNREIIYPDVIINKLKELINGYRF